jgi:hypothetical protein
MLAIFAMEPIESVVWKLISAHRIDSVQLNW